MTSGHERAHKIVQRMIDDGQALSLTVTRLSNGDAVIDAGVKALAVLREGILSTG